MNFSPPRSALFALFACFALAGCHRHIAPEERAARTRLRATLRAGEFAKAVPLARRVLTFSPHDNGAWARLAEAQGSLGDENGLAETLLAWQEALHRPSAKFDEFRGDLALARRQPAEALAAWRESVARRGEHARVFAKIARLEEKDEHWQAAVTAWSEATKLHPSPRALLHRTRCLRHLHRWDEIAADLKKAKALAPDDREVEQAEESFARLSKFLAEVKDLDKELAAAPNDSGLLTDRALLFLRANAPELALDDALRAHALAKEAVRPQLFAVIALHSLGRKKEAAGWPVRTPLRLESLSAQFLQTMSRLDAEIALEPKNAQLRINRAWQLNEIGQPQLALVDAEAASAADPKSAGACAEASYALTKLGRAGEAYAQIQRATTLDPNFSTAWQYRGELEMQKVDYLAAIDSLTHALAINQTAAALSKREECYRKLGLLAKAEEDHKSLDKIRTIR